jgi:predicted transposase YbfD/YdcC
MKSPLLEGIETHFEEVRDPRQYGKIDYPLINIIFITICGVLCGADDWVAITEFAQAQQRWLAKYLDLKNGIPSHDTIGRTFAIINREEFQQGFLNWMGTVSQLIEGVIAVDGKQLRRSHDKGIGKEAIHMVSAWSVANRLVLGQRKVDEKSNEITAIPQLLAALDLTGCIVTIDAMGCQTEITQQIVDQDGDYVLSLKGNQGQLHEDVAEMFDYFESIAFKEIDHDYHKTVNKGHGRLEVRECWVFEPAAWSDYFRTLDKWAGLQSVAMIRTQRQEDDKVTTETRYFISSLAAQAEKILQVVRHHWAIENELHWVLDVAFNEDQSRVRQGYAAENLAVIRHLVMNLLSHEKRLKVSKKNKRLRCAWDVAYREKVLSGFRDLC